jgi:hypothetical protein
LAALFVVRQGTNVETVVSREFARRFGGGGGAVVVYRK